MRSERHEARGMEPIVDTNQAGPILIATVNFGVMGPNANAVWVEVYRLAYERTVEAFRRTGYDRAMVATPN